MITHHNIEPAVSYVTQDILKVKTVQGQEAANVAHRRKTAVEKRVR